MGTLPSDLNNIDNPTTGQPISSAWGDMIRTTAQFVANYPAVSVSTSSATVANTTLGTRSVVGCGDENYDSDGMHSTLSNTSRLTVNTTGTWMAGCSVVFPADSADLTSVREVNLYKNGLLFRYWDTRRFVSATNPTRITPGPHTFVANVGDYFEVSCSHNAPSGSLGVQVQEFWMRLIAYTPI